MSVNIYNPTTGDLTTVADSIDSLEKVSALPSVTTDLIGKIYLLTDEQTGYKKGGIYECQAIEVTPIGTEDPSEEGWYEYVSDEYVLSADTTIDSGKTYYTIEWVLISSSGDTNIFNGTLAEWEALSSEEKSNYSHIATPEEDTPLLPIKSVTVTGTTGSDGMLWGVLSGINIDTILSIRITNALGSNASAILKNANTAPNTVGVYIFGGTNGYSPIGSKSVTLKITYIDV